MLRRLGPDWGVLVTDVGEGDQADDERLVYVFDRRAVSLPGLAGESTRRRSATLRTRFLLTDLSL